LSRRSVRPAEPRDLPALVRLCADHARYERSTYDPDGHAERLATALFGTPQRAVAWVAEVDGEVVGYASGAVEFSTWTAREFLHLDCLYLDERSRGTRLGSDLLSAVRDAAQVRGLGSVQWWTPAWNTDAVGFYERRGARSEERLRFTLSL
jgi:GNAT superfamily N-acetyltransferase